MLPRERVLKTLAHQEPDLVPWGEHFVDYDVYEYILGRPTLMHAKFRETQAWWEGRREEIVADYKRDTVDLSLALGFDVVMAHTMPSASDEQRPMKKIDEETYEDEAGNLWRISATTHDLMPFKKRTDNYEVPTPEGLQEQIDKLDREGVPRPDDSTWEVVRHVVKTLGNTH